MPTGDTRFGAGSVEISTFFRHDGEGNSARDQTDCKFSLQIREGPRSAQPRGPSFFTSTTRVVAIDIDLEVEDESRADTEVVLYLCVVVDLGEVGEQVIHLSRGKVDVAGQSSLFGV